MTSDITRCFSDCYSWLPYFPRLLSKDVVSSTPMSAMLVVYVTFPWHFLGANRALSLWKYQLISLWTKWLPFLQKTFSIAFSWMKMIEFRFKLHRNMFPWVQLTISQHWFRQWLGAKQVTSHYLDQWWPSSLTHICGAKGRWVYRSVTQKPTGGPFTNMD